MKRHLLFKSLLLLCALVVGSGSVWATEVESTSFDATSGYVGDDTNVTFTSYKGGGTSNPAVNSNAIRLYQNSSGATGGYIVIGVPENYVITSATIRSTMATTTGYKLVDSDPEGTTPEKNTFNVSDKSLSANTDYTVGGISTRYIIFACFGTSSSSRLYLSKISITYQSTGGGSDPSISAEDVDIAYDVTEGSISYQVNNLVEGGVLTAAIKGTSDWLTVGTVTSTTVPFTTSVNTGSARSSIVTLTYTYDTDKTVTKDVTVTQAEYVEPVVFTPFYESFDTNDGLAGWSGSAAAKTFKSDNTWETSYAYGGYMCARFGGSSSKLGVATTPALKLDPATTYVLTFNAGAWNGDATNLKLSSDDAIFSGSKNTNVTMANNAWKGYYIVLTGGNASTTITFQGNAASKSRFFLDEVRVMEKSAYDALIASKTVESYGWATYIPDYAVEFESGDAYIVTGILNTDLTLEGVTKVPAKTPVLLKGAGDKTITVISDASVDAPTSISLLTIGNGKALESGYYPYVLAKNGEGACFKLWEGAMSSLNGRVMLVLDEDIAAARGIFDLDSETTAIETVKAQSVENGQYFNLAGQRVAQPTKGLYIVNGKKVIIK